MPSIDPSETIVKQSSLSKQLLNDVNQRLVCLSSPTDGSVNSVVMGGVQDEEGDKISLLTDGLSLTNLATLHGSHLMTPEKTSVPPASSNNLSLSELASMHKSTCTVTPEKTSVPPSSSSNLSLSELASMHKSTCTVTPEKTSVPPSSSCNLSLSELASMHKSTCSVTPEKTSVPPTSSSNLSLSELASMHKSTCSVTPEKTSVPPTSSSNLSLSELASMHVSTCSIENGCSSYNPINSPVQTNPQLASFDFTTGFTTPKTGSTLSLSQLASLGSTPTSSKSIPKSLPFPYTTGGLAALATVHLNCQDNDNISNPIDLSIKPPPGLVPSTDVNVVNSKDAPLAEAMDKLTIERLRVTRAGASAFANIVCMRDRNKPKRLVKRHDHLKRKSWQALIKPQKKRSTFFSFTTPSPDDYIQQKQGQIFNSI